MGGSKVAREDAGDMQVLEYLEKNYNQEKA
jgi:hypothetical protein